MQPKISDIAFIIMMIIVLSVNMYVVLTFEDLNNVKLTLLGANATIAILGTMLILKHPEKKEVKKQVLVRKA